MKEVVMKVENPGNVEVTLSWTMRVSDWKTLRAQLKNEWPGWVVGQGISEAITRVEARFYGEIPEALPTTTARAPAHAPATPESTS